MKLSHLMLMGMIALTLTSGLSADEVLTAGTLNSSALDFDGSTLETDGSLGFKTLSLMLTGSEIPAGAEFAGISSITFDFNALTSSGSRISARSIGSEPGIGVFTPGETGEAIVGFDPIEEGLAISVSSTSNTGQEVLISGVNMSNWQSGASFAQFVGPSPATIGGDNTYTGASNILVFDNAVSSLILTGGDSVRLSGIRLSVTGVPEPGSAGLLTVISLALLMRRKKS